MKRKRKDVNCEKRKWTYLTQHLDDFTVNEAVAVTHGEDETTLVKQELSALKKKKRVTKFKHKSYLTRKKEMPVTLVTDDEASKTSIKQNSGLKRKKKVSVTHDKDDERQNTGLIRNKEVAVTLKRKRRKSKPSDRESKKEKDSEVVSDECKEKKTFNWRNYQWKKTIDEMNLRVLDSLSPSLYNRNRNSQEQNALFKGRQYRISHKKMKSGIIKLPSLDVPSEWILESSQVGSRNDIIEEATSSDGSTSPVPEEASNGWIIETS